MVESFDLPLLCFKLARGASMVFENLSDSEAFSFLRSVLGP